MPEHQQVQQSTESKSNAQKQVTTASPTQASNPYLIIQRAKINPKSLTHADIMQLQRTIGNRAVGMLLSSIRNSSTAQQATVQRQEIPEEEEPLQGKMDETVQRQEAPEEEEPLQGKMTSPIQLQEIPEPEEEPPLQGKFENKTQQERCPSCSTLPIQRETENRTGMPDDLKAGVENLSGIDMSDVRVHYNSSKPGQVGALAYTQRTNIHVAPGQEKHLPHEAWHLVQQAQGRVMPTMQLKGIAINDDTYLENEADVMGEKINLRQMILKSNLEGLNQKKQDNVIQGVFTYKSVNIEPRWLDKLDQIWALYYEYGLDEVVLRRYNKVKESENKQDIFQFINGLEVLKKESVAEFIISDVTKLLNQRENADNHTEKKIAARTEEKMIAEKYAGELTANFITAYDHQKFIEKSTEILTIYEEMMNNPDTIKEGEEKIKKITFEGNYPNTLLFVWAFKAKSELDDSKEFTRKAKEKLIQTDKSVATNISNMQRISKGPRAEEELRKIETNFNTAVIDIEDAIRMLEGAKTKANESIQKVEESLNQIDKLKTTVSSLKDTEEKKAVEKQNRNKIIKLSCILGDANTSIETAEKLKNQAVSAIKDAESEVKNANHIKDKANSHIKNIAEKIIIPILNKKYKQYLGHTMVAVVYDSLTGESYTGYSGAKNTGDQGSLPKKIWDTINEGREKDNSDDSFGNNCAEVKALKQLFESRKRNSIKTESISSCTFRAFESETGKARGPCKSCMSWIKKYNARYVDINGKVI